MCWAQAHFGEAGVAAAAAAAAGACASSSAAAVGGIPTAPLSCVQVQTDVLCAAVMWQSLRNGLTPGNVHLQV
jgi:hypothetical protein